jgi:hypothetical protein
MRILTALVALSALLVTVALAPVIGGVLFALVTFGVFVLALVGVLAGLENHTVRQRNPSLNPRAWRDGSS